MEKISLITGGAGFIGCALSRLLAESGDRVVAVDNLLEQVHLKRERPAELMPDVDLRIADVRDSSFWDAFLSQYRPETVIHLAAETGTAQSLSVSTRHGSVNVVGTTEMLDAFSRNKVIPAHLVLASSRAVYGEGAWIDAENRQFYPGLRSHEQLSKARWDFENEGLPSRPLAQRAKVVFPNPSSIYGATKLAQEHIMAAWAGAMKVPLTALRLQNVYGPGQSPHNPYTGIINLFHKAAYSGKAIDIYEDGNIGRDFVFIDDVARAFLASIRRPPSERRLLDVGSGNVTTIISAAQHIAQLHGAPTPQVTGKFRDGDIRWAVADVTDLREELGIESEVDFIGEGAKAVGDWLIAKGFMQ